jgi:hypothetical protein
VGIAGSAAQLVKVAIIWSRSCCRGGGDVSATPHDPEPAVDHAREPTQRRQPTRWSAPACARVALR